MKQKFKQLNAFTLAVGGHSPLLCGDEGTQGSPYLVKAAFTLAEVLITLGVIGVVAAVTMPTLIKNYQKKQTVTQLKKAYTELSQAFALAQKDFGAYEDWDFKNFESPSERSQYFYDNFLKPYLKIVKYCVPSSNDCWTDTTYDLRGAKYSPLYNNIQGHNTIITAAGYSVYYWLHGVGTGGMFFVDINGKKQPNMLGNDIFAFVLYIGSENRYYHYLGFHPYGLFAEQQDIAANEKRYRTREQILNEGNADCGKNGYGSGSSCSALIMVDNWEIKDDYPW